MGLFKHQKIEKESNIATTPSNKLPTESFSRLKFFLLLWNIVSIGIYVCYISFLVLQSSSGKFLFNFIKWVLYIYIGIFVLLLFVSIFQRKQFKSRMKNYKSAFKFLKYFVQIVTLVLSIVTVLSTFLTTGKANAATLTTAMVSLCYTILMVLFEVVKILIRKNIPTVKRNFLVIREKREEQLILLGKKKKKLAESESEQASENEEEPATSAQARIEGPNRKELPAPKKENKERYAKPVVFYEDDDDEDEDYYNDSYDNNYQNKDYTHNGYVDDYYDGDDYDDYDNGADTADLNETALLKTDNDPDSVNQDVEKQTSKFKGLYKKFLNKIKRN